MGPLDGRSAGELKADYPCENQRDTQESRGRGGFRKEDDTEDHGADRADSGPDRVARAERYALNRQCQEEDAGDHSQQGKHRWPESGESFCVFEANGPADFEDAGDSDVEPVHK